MVALHRSCATRAPPTGEIQVVGALTSDMALTDVLLKSESALSREIDMVEDELT
jgi:hypothetical protein